jgi:hypothetical protein
MLVTAAAWADIRHRKLLVDASITTTVPSALPIPKNSPLGLVAMSNGVSRLTQAMLLVFESNAPVDSLQGIDST